MNKILHHKSNFLKLSISTLLLLASPNLYSLDRIQIFFESGSFKIDEKQQIKLKTIPSKYNLADLDSVWFIGKADSLGKAKSNIKLSNKRANAVADYCKGILPKNIPIRINGLGEKQKQIEFKDRSVTIVLFFTPVAIEEKPITKDTIIPLKGCYYIDDTLLARSNIRIITKGKKKFVLIEVAIEDLDIGKKLYSASEAKLEDIIPKPVRWIKRKSGKLWWLKERYQTTIPKEDFDKYKIFFVRAPACSECSINLTSAEKGIGVDSCLWESKFLMDNVQVKTILFNRKFLRLRAPIEYVDLSTPYYFNYNLNEKIKWKSVKGLRNRNYYTAKIPIYTSFKNYYFNGISQKKRCCPPYRYKGGGFLCCRGFMPGGLTLMLETGDNYLKKEHQPYVGLLLNYEWNDFNLNLILGTDNNWHFYSGIRFQYNYFTFPLTFLNPFARWQNPKDLNPQKSINYSHYKIAVGRMNLYAGAEYRRSKNENDAIFSEQNIHTGIAMKFDNRNLQRIFVQYGMGYDFNKINSTKAYPLLQFGLVMAFRLY